jgi:hypothetical protein
MKKEHILKKVEEYPVLDAMICDICKKEYTDQFEIQEFFYIRHTGSYLSIFGDEMVLHIDICQHCMKKMLVDSKVDLEQFVKEIQL